MAALLRASAIGLLIAGSISSFAYGSEIQIGTGEFPPYTTESTDDQGCVIRIIKSVYEAEGWTVGLEFMSWPRNLVMLSRGDIDASAYWAPRSDRVEKYIYPKNPVSSGSYYFVFRKNDTIKWDTFEDLRGKTIIINKDYTYTEAFYEALKKFNIKEDAVAQVSQNLKMLLKGRADLTIMQEKVFRQFAQELSDEERSRLYFDPKPALTINGFLIFSRSDSERSQTLAKIFDSGYEKIRKREDLQDAFKTCGL